jgi:hypothetical protein
MAHPRDLSTPPTRPEPPARAARPLLHALGGRKLFMALGPVVAVVAAASSIAWIHFSPLAVGLKQVAFSTATTQFYVASRQSLSNTDVRPDLFSEHAQALAQMMTSPELRGYIARAAAIPASRLAVDGPVANNLQRTQQEPTEQKRSSQILTEGDPYRLTLDDDPATSVIAVTAQAPTEDGAIALADGAGSGLAQYVIALERKTGDAPADGVEISQLAPAVATPPRIGGEAQVAGFTFAVVLLVWWLLVQGGAKLITDLRAGVREVRLAALIPVPQLAEIGPSAAVAGPPGRAINAATFAIVSVLAVRRGPLVAARLAAELREKERRKSSSED